MMKRLSYLLAVLCVLFFASCGNNASNSNSTDGVNNADSTNKVTDAPGGGGDILKELSSSYTQDGKDVELEGYLSVPNFMLVSGDRVELGLYPAAGQQGDQLAKAIVKFGKDGDSFYVPEKYQSSDAEIYDHSGQKHGYNTKVKIAGKVKYTNKDWADGLDKEPVKDPNAPAALHEVKRKSWEKKKADAEARKAKTGDSNDYTFEVKVLTITIP